MNIFRKVLYYILILLCIFGVIYSGYNIYIWKKSVDANSKIQKELEKSIEIIKKDIDRINEETDELMKTEVYKDYVIDFKLLKETNPDTVAYINVNDTNIKYIVVKGIDNSYYLNHSFDKSYNVAGWIFSHYKNKFDGSDRNIVVFGHNTSDNSMFGTLKNTLKKDWQEKEENLFITFITEEEKNIYQVFSTYNIIPEDYYINTEFKDDSEFLEFVNTIKARSNYDFGVEVNEHDQILTLSSCTPGGAQRVVLHAKKLVAKN